ncbi:hypothetical protein DY000_02022881 [Brassica cretica]|uniref:DUF4283 domain-containing protein n=1 Tax=Brassica cretica TaxID=69181 RepID=A0ABQ7E2G3_BRACR|nr:hypothetical protein DY000_02022881 [Brassica cretica]
MSLIGKVLNPKKQNVEKLLQTMPTQWGLQDRITANDLGKGKFLFNFTTEEDLMSILQKGPFHYNYCMFVLVRWEPVVHDDYPWIIPFWVQLYGLPLHLWTVTNLKNVGSRIGHVDVDSIELTEGRMRIEVDSRRPLKFKRKVESPDAEEVTIDIKYDMMFKHCTTCGLMSHEKGYCPTLDTTSRVSSERGGVFARVQVPQDRNNRQPSPTDYNQPPLRRDDEPVRNGTTNREMVSRWSETRHQKEFRGRYHVDHGNQNRNKGAGDRFRSHSDRIIRRRDERPSGNRYGGSRYQCGPYDRKDELTWCEKKMNNPLPINSPEERYLEESEVAVSRESRDNMRLASTIVTPSHQLPPQEENITFRGKNVAMSLTFSPQNGGAENDQVIGALEDMEILDTNDGGMMDFDVQEDDLLAGEVMDMDEQERHISMTDSSNVMLAQSTKKSYKSGTKRNAPLGIQSKKKEFFRQGSPRA